MKAAPIEMDILAPARSKRPSIHAVMITVFAATTWVFQTSLGGSQEILALCMISIFVGAIAVRQCGLWSSLGMLLVTLIAFFPVSALVMKSIMLEPIQDGLFVPETSFEIMCIGMVSASLAAGLVNLMGPGRGNHTVFVGPLNPKSLQLLAGLSALLGAFGFLGHDLPGGWGRSAALLGNFVFLVPICLTQVVLEQTNGRKSVSFLSALAIAAVVFLSIGNNSKHGAIAPIVSYFLTCASFRLSLTRAQIVSGIAVAVVLLSVVAPAINVARNLRSDVGFIELMARTGNVAESILSGETDSLAYLDIDDRVGYANNYISSRSAGFDRLAFVSYIDAIVRFVGSVTVGYQPFLDSVARSLVPNLSDPGQKGVGSNGDWVLQQFGVFSDDVSSQITLPLFAEGYVADGLRGVALWSFCGMFAVSLELVFVFGALHRNVLSIFLISVQGFLFASSGMSSLLFFIVRMAPLFVAAYAVCRGLGGRRRTVGVDTSRAASGNR